MAGVTRWRAAAAMGTAALMLALLSACVSPFTPGESSNGMTSSEKTDSLAEAITATSANITTTYVETGRDGLTTNLWVNPVLSGDSLSASELDAVLKAAYSAYADEVSSIEVRAEDAAGEPVALGDAASTLGIHFLPNTNSVTFMTSDLDAAYGK